MDNKIAQTNDIMNTTLVNILPTVINDIVDSSAFVGRVLSKYKNWSGTSTDQVMEVELDDQNFDNFQGLEPASTQESDTSISLKVYPTGARKTINVAYSKVSINKTTSGVIDYIAKQTDLAKTTLCNLISTQFYGRGDGMQFAGLESFIDDGTNTSEYGGISRASYPIINANRIAASGGTMTLDLIRSAYDAASAVGNAKQNVNAIFCDKNSYGLYEKIATDKARYVQQVQNVQGYDVTKSGVPTGDLTNKGMMVSTGFVGIDFRGASVVPDSKAPAGTMYFLNDRYIDFHSVKFYGLSDFSKETQVAEGAYSSMPALGALQYRDFTTNINQLGATSMIVLFGNIICRNPHRNAKLVGITNA